MIWKRVLSAGVFMGLLGLGLAGPWWWCEWLLAVMAMVISVWCLFEMEYIASAQTGRAIGFPAYVVGVLVPIALVLGEGVHRCDWSGWLLGLGVLIWLVGTPLWQLVRGQQRALELIAITFWATAYVVLPPALCLVLRDHPQGLWIIGYVLAVTWLNDTGAFFVGRTCGKHPMAPRLSPRKTWEGCLGGGMLGLTGVGILGIVYNWYGPGPHPFLGQPVPMLILGMILVATGWLGDLLESLLKREAQLKDSGPDYTGHGGILDMTDSLFINIPVACLLLWLVYGELILPS